MPDRVDPDPKGPFETPRRKRYRTPRLERLGTLTEITASIGTRGKNDHGGPGLPRKTS